MKKSAIIVAGGAGTRMESEVPKQFLLIDNVPILIHTVRKFLAFDPSINIIVVLPRLHVSHWDTIKNQFLSNTEIQTVFGGNTRSASVQAGLTKVTDGLVAIHDAVRPFVSIDTINNSFESAKNHGSGVAVVPLKDSIRMITGQASQAKDRADFVLVQTPQTFAVDLLKVAYQTVGDQSFTDDASVFEAAGNQVALIDGSYENIKITTPDDLQTR